MVNARDAKILPGRKTDACDAAWAAHLCAHRRILMVILGGRRLSLRTGFWRGGVGCGSGSIVNVSTMAARIGMPGLSLSSATKAGLEPLTPTWAAELSPVGVRVNTVARPGRARGVRRGVPGRAGPGCRRRCARPGGS